MYMVTIKGKTQPGKLTELAQKWHEFYGPRLAGFPELRSAHFGGDEDSSTVVTVIVWERKPDDVAMRDTMHEFSGIVHNLMAGPPTVEGYEVLQAL